MSLYSQYLLSQQYTRPTNNNYTQDNLKLSTIHAKQIRDFTTCTKDKKHPSKTVLCTVSCYCFLCAIYMPISVQQHATIYSLFISVNRSTCFGWYLHPSSGAHVTVSTVSPFVIVTGRELPFPSSHDHERRYCGYSDMSS